jgi:hypothetical protein
MRLQMTTILAAALLGLGCEPPRCPHVRVISPATEGTVSWLDPGRPRVQAGVQNGTRLALLDTGFPRSSEMGDGFIDASTPVVLGGATVGPMHWGFVFPPDPEFDLIVGADALSYVPLVFDARAAQTRIERDFTPGDGAAPLTRWSSGLCLNDAPGNGPEGPDLLLVEADLDGQSLVLALDTGADVTFVRPGALPDLSSRPTLTGLPLRTAFAGNFTATATRARALSVGGQASLGSPVLTAPELDVGLDNLLKQFRHPPPRLDGALGRSFFREFEVSLALGDDAVTNRALGLTRFDTQTHWSRDLVGIGIATTPENSPLGLRIAALFSTSPARDAGLQVGDIILNVNGTLAAELPQPWGQPGDVVHLDYSRQGSTLTADVPILDLLPDP